MQSKNKRLGLDPVKHGALSKKEFCKKFLSVIGNLQECEEMYAKCVTAYEESKKKQSVKKTDKPKESPE